MPAQCLDNTDPAPSLYRRIKAGFVMQGGSLTEWCRANGIDRSWAFQCLNGKRKGPAASALIRLISRESGVGR